MMISSSEEKSLPQKLSEDIIAFILKENLIISGNGGRSAGINFYRQQAEADP